VIKRIRLGTRAAGRDPDALAAGWQAAVRCTADAPDAVRPLRATVAVGLEATRTTARYDGVGLAWFRDVAHHDAYARWRLTEGAHVDEELADALDLDRSPLLVADEHVARGADWLAARWASGGGLKHLAIASRAEGLTAAEFSERWRNRAGVVRDASGTIVTIPDEARGCAYVQNHLLPPPPEGWAHDAVNEVHLPDDAALRTRIEWFAEHLDPAAEADLVRDTSFLAVHETLVFVVDSGLSL